MHFPLRFVALLLVSSSALISAVPTPEANAIAEPIAFAEANALAEPVAFAEAEAKTTITDGGKIHRTDSNAEKHFPGKGNKLKGNFFHRVKATVKNAWNKIKGPGGEHLKNHGATHFHQTINHLQNI